MPLDLTDEVLPFTPVDVDKPFVMAPGAAMPSPFAGPFPPAHEGLGLINTAGEYRGVYPTTSGYAWLPDWSTYRSVRASPTKPHWGIDLYAPVGTALVAVVGGSVDFLTDPGNKLGLYARLRFVVAGKEYALHYGHMSRAEGGPRTILKGAILGYVGCSGNADQNQSCSVNVPGKTFSASHVHVALLPPAPSQTLMRSNPIGVFGWMVITPKTPTGVSWVN